METGEMTMVDNPTTERKPWWRTLRIYFSDPEERQIYNAGPKSRYRFRFPWSHLASVRMMREIGWEALEENSNG
jgi:hypothetical protein